MKAIVYHNYGSPNVLNLEDIEKPSPKDDEVLVKVRATSVNAGTWHLMRGEPFLVRMMFGILKPKIKVLGADVAGEVEAVGKNVKQFKPRDEVYGDLSGCGFGGFAEYVAVPESALAPKPAHVTFEEAAAVPSAATTALQALRDKGQIQPGQKVLVNGASGGVGTYAVQIAKSFGAEVTGVCSTRNVDMVRSIGADHVIDYKKEDFTKNGQQYDLIIDAAAFRSIADYKPALSPTGTYVMVGGSTAQFFQSLFLAPWLSMFSGKKMSNMLKKPSKSDLAFLKKLLETGKVKTVVGKRYTLSETPAAIRYLEEEHARGKVVITV